MAICKAKVLPLRGLTVPRGELTALTLLPRLMLSVILALRKLEHLPSNSLMLIDSKCSISAVDTKIVLKPYFQNGVAEIRDNMEHIRKHCELESSMNPSNLSARAAAPISQLGPNSCHQSGPEFFQLTRSEWPAAREFTSSDIPDDEVKLGDKSVFVTALRANFFHSKVHPGNPWQVIEDLLYYSEDIKKIIRIIACYLRGLEAGFRHSEAMVISNPVTYNQGANAIVNVEHSTVN